MIFCDYITDYVSVSSFSHTKLKVTPESSVNVKECGNDFASENTNHITHNNQQNINLRDCCTKYLHVNVFVATL